MATDLERLVVQLSADIKGYENALRRAQGITNRQTRQITSQFDRMNRGIAAGFGRLGASIGAALAGGAALRGAQQLIDAATRIENALKVAGLSGDELKGVYDRLFDSAQRNAAPIETLVTLFGRATLVQNELKVSQEELLQFTDRVALALRVAGMDAQAASGALLQLSQALGSGVVRAEEFNSIQEGALPILQAVAAGLEEAGGSVAQLRNLVIDGQVSSEAFFRAFEAGAAILEDKVAGAELTVSQRFVRLQNVMIRVAGEFDEATGASEATGEALDRLAGAVEALGEILIRIANGPIGTFIGKLGELDAMARSVLGFLGNFSLNDELAGALGGIVAPEPELTEEAIRQSAARMGIGPKVETTPKTGRITAPRRTVSLADFDAPAKKGGGRGRGGGSRENDYQREIRQIQERTAAIQAETAAMASINPLINDYGFAVEQASAKQELLNAAKEAGLAITPQLEAQIEALATGYAQASSEAARLAEEQDRVRQVADDFRDLGKDVMSGFISDLREGKSASEALANALQKVGDRLLDMALTNLFSGGFGGGKGGLFGGFLIPGVLHKGGVAGQDGYGHGRKVSPAAFVGAPRYHSGGIAGIRPGEVPAILQRGEIVIPRGRARSVGGSSVVINAPINAPGADAAQLARVEQSVKELGRNIPKMVDQRVDTRQTRKVRA